jgi:phospholipid/cholesterol/gamma-HCH transport system ATP-binding protein
MTGNEAVIRVRDLVVGFGAAPVLDRVTLDVVRGEILGFVGGSGAGKSVLMRTIIGLLPKRAGTIEVFGSDLASLDGHERRAVERRCGVLFQQGALFSSLSVAQNVMLPIREHTDVDAPERERIAAMKLELAGMPADAGVKFPSQLSGGMVKRAAFARALALDPKVLFLDEPTSDLDPLTASGIDAMIGKLNEGLGVTVVIVTHDLTTLFTLCDRIAVLVDGKLTVGPLARLLRSDEPWIHAFLHGPRARGAVTARRQARGNG